MEALVGSARGIGLHGSVVRRSLLWCLLTTLLLGMLIAILLLVRVALRVLTMIPLIRWSLVPLLEALLSVGAWTSIASRGLSLKPPLLSLHLFALIVNNNGVIHQHPKVGVCIGHKLELGAQTSPTTPGTPRCSNIASYVEDSSVLGHRQLRRRLLGARTLLAMTGTPRCSDITSDVEDSSVLGHRQLR